MYRFELRMWYSLRAKNIPKPRINILPKRSSTYCSGANKAIIRKYPTSKKEEKILYRKMVELFKEEITDRN